MWIPWLVFAGLADASGPDDPAPSDQWLAFTNARLALREGDPTTAIRFWFLRNAIQDQTGQVSNHDADFRSVIWAAFGDLGRCAEGYPIDHEGAGLWPVSLFNWAVRRRPEGRQAQRPSLFRALEVGRQARSVSLDDVLSADELHTLSLAERGCSLPRRILVDAGEHARADLSDRGTAVRLLGYLLDRANDTLEPGLVRGHAAVDARQFEINQVLAEHVVRATDDWPVHLPRTPHRYTARARRVLESTLHWPVDEWMTLSTPRRLRLYDEARAHLRDPDAFDDLALQLLDASIERREGTEVEHWIARYQGNREVIWGQDRGWRLRGLAPESGFREWAVIALHQGIEYVEQDEPARALTSFAFALRHATASRNEDDVRRQARDWLSHVAADWTLTETMHATLQELVPDPEYGPLLEGLLWTSAFRCDGDSFRRATSQRLDKGARGRRSDLLEALALGEGDRFEARLRDELAASSHDGLRFVTQLLARFEQQALDIRLARVGMLTRVGRQVAVVARGDDRAAAEAVATGARIQSLIDGLRTLDVPPSHPTSAMPTHTVFGGVRLAPADAPAWPFERAEVRRSSLFDPLELHPVEWKDPDGDWVFGWRIEG